MEVSIILDWIFEGIVTWIASIVTQIMDAISGIFLNALGTDMVTMEEYFPFVTMAFTIMQYMAWCILFLITVWQLFRTFGGPITEAENPWQLLARSTIFALLIGYARPIFSIALNIARAPYTALMDASMDPGDFTFAGIENVLTNGIVTLVSVATVVGLLLIIILMIALGWNYFKLLLEVVERYIVVGVLCYTSPLAFSMGASKATSKVFQSWCRMVGSQLLLLVLNVWFLRAFNSSVGHFSANAGSLTTGQGNIFLWLFCALAFLKTAQRFDSYLSALGLNVAQTGGSMGMEMLMAARVIGGFGGTAGKTAGSVFRGGASSAGGSTAAAGASVSGAAGATGFAAGFASKFKGNSYVRDSVVQGGSRMGAGGGIGFVGRTFGGMAARTGASLTGESISSVATRHPSVSGSIGGAIADRSLSNYMPQLAGSKLSDTQITGGAITTTATGSNGQEASVRMYSAAQFDKPEAPHSVVKASDGSTWYQTATGAGMGEFYSAPKFSGDISEAPQVAAAFPGTPEGTMLRTVDNGVIEAVHADGSTSMWYNSAHYGEPDAPHESVASSSGVEWYAMQPHANAPQFETGDSDTILSADGTGAITPQQHTEVPQLHGGDAPQFGSGYSDGGTLASGQGMYGTPPQFDGGMAPTAASPQAQDGISNTSTIGEYNKAQFRQFMPGYEHEVSRIDASHKDEGRIEVRHKDGTGTAFYDKTMYGAPRGDHRVYEDSKGSQWYAISGTPAVEHRPVYENGKPVHDGGKIKTESVESIKYKTTPTKFAEPQKRNLQDSKPPKRKQ